MGDARRASREKGEKLMAACAAAIVAALQGSAHLGANS